MRQNKKKGHSLSGLLLLLFFPVLAAIIPIRADWHIQAPADNRISTGLFRTRIEEEYIRPGKLLPSQSVKKIVHVRNSGSVDAIVRLRVEKSFGRIDQEGKFQITPWLDPEWIQIQYDESGVWAYQDDGYYYYTEVLKAGERSREPLMTAFTLSADAANSVKGQEGRILITLESVQAESDAVSLWNKEKEDLISAYEAAVEESRTRVWFKGEKQGFGFHPKSTDLFAGFKNMCPGSARTQTIELSNQSSEKIAIYLQAEAVSQDQMSGEDKEKLQKLLTEYGRIQVRTREDNLYEGAPDGNLQGRSEEASLGTKICLGEWETDETKELVVSLHLSPEMDNSFMALSGKIRWIFSAEGREPYSETILTPSPLPLQTATPSPVPGSSTTGIPSPTPHPSQTATPSPVPGSTGTGIPTSTQIPPLNSYRTATLSPKPLGTEKRMPTPSIIRTEYPDTSDPFDAEGFFLVFLLAGLIMMWAFGKMMRQREI